jgi:hypothetical protein
MNDLPAIENDPSWLPHEIDGNGRRVRFIKLAPAQLSGRSFLAEVSSVRAEAWVGFDRIVAMRPVTAPLHFIFHSGFCRSTLLLQALSVPGRTAFLNEPGILNSLARMETIEPLVFERLTELLARPHIARGGERPFWSNRAITRTD